jgi:hypothetical protein
MEVGKFLNRNYSDEGKWYGFGEKVPGASDCASPPKMVYSAEVKIKKLTPKERKTILKNNTVIRKGVEKVDFQNYGQELAVQSISDWKGFTSNGDDLECSRDNKIFLLENYFEFCEFVLSIVNPDQDVLVAEEIKN